MKGNKKSESEFLKSLSRQGREICSELTRHGKSRTWLAKQLEISPAALNYKLKGVDGYFTKSEEMAISFILGQMKKKIPNSLKSNL